MMTNYLNADELLLDNDRLLKDDDDDMSVAFGGWLPY